MRIRVKILSPARRGAAALPSRSLRSARFSVRHDTTGFTTVDSRRAEFDSEFQESERERERGAGRERLDKKHKCGE